MTERVELWEQQPGETAVAFEAFKAYRDLGPKRSVQKACGLLAKSKGTLDRWYTPNRWRERAEAWDAEQDRLDREAARKARDKEIADMHKRHIDLATAMIFKATQGLQSLPKEEIKAADITRMVDVATKLERLSRGDVGEVIEERDGGKATNPVVFYMPDNHRSDDPEK